MVNHYRFEWIIVPVIYKIINPVNDEVVYKMPRMIPSLHIFWKLEPVGQFLYN